ncbi:MAG TPA: S8 family serine peptidase [Hanamia sp.]
MKKIILTLVGCFLISFFCIQVFAQSGAEQPAKRPHDWWQADPQKDSLPGISLDEAYNYLKGRKSKPVIVAIIDDCIDTSHEDLKNILWTNKKEIAGNGIDDDKNGYVDDVHGWCFVCGKNNTSQNDEAPDGVRTYITWRKQFENIDTSTLTGSLKIEYSMYQLSKKKVFAEYKKMADSYQLITLAKAMRVDTFHFMQYLNNLSVRYKDTILYNIPFATIPFSTSYDSLENIFWSVFNEKRKEDAQAATLEYLIGFMKALDGEKYFFETMIGIDNLYDTTKNYRMVEGDDDNDFKTIYGAPTIKVPGHSDWHATLIAGIIAANRQNNIGIKGIADNVLLMPVVIGKEAPSRDKDIVFAIHYAVDNGASIINLSMGGTPAYSEHVKEIMEAFDYASRHGVLFVNCAGNDGVNMDNEIYNLGQGSNGKDHDDYIRVGATTTLLNDSLVSVFSNFGGKTVDLFAPGTAIYSTTPGNKYDFGNGTSFATPVVVGVAALLKSYFPSLTAKQLKEILVKSVYKPDIMVITPYNSGIKNKIPFSTMSKSGGIVNAYNAVKLADEMTRKEK